MPKISFFVLCWLSFMEMTKFTVLIDEETIVVP